MNGETTESLFWGGHLPKSTQRLSNGGYESQSSVSREMLSSDEALRVLRGHRPVVVVQQGGKRSHSPPAPALKTKDQRTESLPFPAREKGVIQEPRRPLVDCHVNTMNDGGGIRAPSVQAGHGTRPTPAVVYGEHRIAQQQQQQQQQSATREEYPVEANGGSRIPHYVCCHQVPYDVCVHRKTHLRGISAEVEACFEQLVESDGTHFKEIQKECKRLLDIRNVLQDVCGSGSAVVERMPSATMAVHGPNPVTPPVYGDQTLRALTQQNQHQQYAGGEQYQQHNATTQNNTYNHQHENQQYSFSMDHQATHVEPQGDGLMGEHAMLEIDTRALKSLENDRVDASDDPAWKKDDFPWSDAMKEENVSLFGNTSFRLHQHAVMNATLAGRDVFVLMPTGGGKSLCYQLPAVLSQGVTVVITPLVSLIQDQVFHLTNLGISAKLLGSYEKGNDAGATMREVMRGNVNVLFLTPEKLDASPGTRSMLEKLHSEKRLSRVVIDEAHCVSQWGHGMYTYV